MIKQEVLSELFGVMDDLSERIIQNAPQAATDRKAFDDLMRRRDGVNGAINAVIAEEFKEIVDSPDLQRALDGLADVTSKLKALANTLKTIDAAVVIADQVIGVVVQIIKLAAL